MEQTPLRTVSNSEVDTYRQCRLKHQLSYIERWRTDDEVEALARGTLFHLVMERHYGVLRGWRKDPVPDMTLGEAAWLTVSPLLYDDKGHQTDRQELVEWIYRGYVDYYGQDEDWEIVAVEVPLDFELPNPNGGPSEFRLAGTADLVVRDRSAGGGLWIVDHKTCKDLPKKDFDLEDQTAVYSYLLKRAGYDIRGAIYNHCRTYKLKTRMMDFDERFKRSITVRGEQELETCAQEVYELMEEAYDGHDRRAARAEHSFTDGEGINVVHQLYDAPRSPDGERCGWKCGYTEACIAGRKMGPDRTRQFLLDTGFTMHTTKPGPTFNKELQEGQL
jgi:RecB family exonuclease